MANNPCVPFWDEGNTFTGHASEAITGCRAVVIAGPRVDGNPRVAHTLNSATVRTVGVAAYDAPSGGKVTIYSGPGIVVPVMTAEAVDAGDDLYSDADGAAVDTQPSGARPFGMALDDAASGTLVPVKLY